jgi:hypothetical protein
MTDGAKLDQKFKARFCVSGLQSHLMISFPKLIEMLVGSSLMQLVL